jgi:dihydrodipicolinate synthase/N-acetylneuraminate lyase
MPPQELQGILVALITPFVDDGSAVHEERLKMLINRFINAGVHGLVPGGTTGEFTALTIAERKYVLELCIKFTAGRVPVVAGIGALSTRDCVDMAKHAVTTGVAAVMVVPPFYDPVNYTQLRELMKEVHETSRLPIVYYNIPSASGLTLSPQEMASLSVVGVRYIKDTSGNGPALTELLFELDNKVTTFTGWDTLTFYGLTAGAKGSIWGASNIIPELSIELWNSIHIHGDLKTAQELWRKIFPICKFLESRNYPSAVKTALKLLGYETGGLRKPFDLLSDGPTAEMEVLLVNAGLQTVRMKLITNGS